MDQENVLKKEDPKVARSYLTTRQAARLLGVSLGSVQQWAEAGLLDFWKTGGGHRRITRESVENFKRKRMPVVDEPPRVAPSAPPQLRILVVEDEPTLLRLYRLRISSWPFAPEVRVARNGLEALLKIGEQRPHLLITDLYMPEMDGFKMLRMLRSRPDTEDITIVAVSGLDDEEIAERGGVPEGVRLLHKPIPFPELETIARQVAASRGLIIDA